MEETAITLLSGWLNLDSLSIIRLATVVLSLVIGVHLLRVSPRTLPSVFLAGAFLGAFLFNTASFFELAGPLYWQPRNLRTILVNLFYDIGPAFASVCLLLFAYHFPRFRNAERREYRVVLPLSIALNTAVLGLSIVNHLVLQWRFSDTRLWDIYWTVFYCSLAVQFLGVIALLFRKAARLSGHGSASLLRRLLHPSGRDAAAARAIGTILLLPLLAVAASLATTWSVVAFSLGGYLTWLGLLLFYLGFVVAYLTYTSDPLTLQLKLLGVVLLLILSTMGLVALFVGVTSARDYAVTSLPRELSTLRFSLNARQGYTIVDAPDTFDPQLGPRLQLEYAKPWTCPLPFDFPFFASHYHRIHILNGPMIYLGERVQEDGWGGYNPQPAIAAIIMNLNPALGGGVHLKSDPDCVTITWFHVPELGQNNSNTVQLALHSNGSIDMRFEQLQPSCGPSLEQQYDYTAASTTGGDPAPGGRPAPFPPRLTGIHPGGSSPPLVPIDFQRGLPWSEEGPAVLFQSYEADFANYLNGRIGVLAILTLGACLLVVTLIPLLLRSSLFMPLRGLAAAMQRVEAGDWDAVVKVGPRDEIGLLARSFNRMLDSTHRVESSFRMLAENTRDGILLFSDERVVYANRRAAELTNRTPPDLAARSFSDVFLSIQPPPYGVQPETTEETELSTAAGRRLPVELEYSWTVWHGRPALAVIVRDITLRKREEEAAHVQQQNLLRLDKLTSLGVLAAGLAHEVNVPNQVIMANASLLNRGSAELATILEEAMPSLQGFLVAGMEASEFRRKYPDMVASISGASTLIDGVVRNLREFSAEASSQLAAPLDINTAVRNAVELLAAYIRKATDRFSMDLQPGLPPTRGSVTRLQQVFINLILNACQNLGSRDRAVSVRSSILQDDAPMLLVTVHDEGAGMTPEVLARACELFFTTREAAGGTGLGLYVSHEIVAAHGGTLRLASRPGAGTDAEVALPTEARS